MVLLLEGYLPEEAKIEDTAKTPKVHVLTKVGQVIRMNFLTYMILLRGVQVLNKPAHLSRTS